MPKIKEYEAPQGKIKPSFRGMEAAQQAGRYIYRIAREGNQDLTRGISEIGSAIEGHEKRQERREAKAEAKAAKAEREEERYQNKMDRAEAKADRAQAKQDAEDKRQDKAKALEEANQAKPEFAKLHQQFARELAQMEATTKPAELPQKIAEWREQRVKPAYEALSQQYFQSDAGKALGRKWTGTHEAAIYGHSSAAASSAQSHAVMDQIHREVSTHLETIMSNPEHTEDVVKQFRETFNDTVSLTPPGNISTAGTPQGQVAAVLKARGWSDAAIQGALNNAEIESAHFRSDIVDGTGKGAGGAKGIFQLDPGTGDGKDHLTAYTKKYGNDWSIQSQTTYMAEWVEKNMPLYKNSANPENATRLFMTQFENPKDQSPAAQQLRIDQSKTSATFASGGLMPPAMMNAQVRKTFEEGLHTYAVAQVHAVAAGHAPGTYGPNDPGRGPDPNAAKALMNNEGWWGKTVLTPKDRDPMGSTSIARAIDLYDHAQQKQLAHDQATEMNAAKTRSAIATVGYLNELKDKQGHLTMPPDWSQRIIADPDLRAEEKRALVGGQKGDKSSVQDRLLSQYQNAQPGAFNPMRLLGPADVVEPPSGGPNPLVPTDKGPVMNVLNQIRKPGGYDLGSILQHIGTDINHEDAMYLLRYINPNNPYAKDEADALMREIGKAHDTLAPPLPNGQRNAAGEAAFNKYLGEYLIPQHKMRDEQGAGLSSLDPHSPEYLQKDNIIQKYAPGHKDITSPVELKPNEKPPSLSDILGPEKKEEKEAAAADTTVDTADADMEKDLENLGRDPALASNE